MALNATGVEMKAVAAAINAAEPTRSILKRPEAAAAEKWAEEKREQERVAKAEKNVRIMRVRT